MAMFFTSGQVALLLMIVTLLEFFLLAVWQHRTGRGIAPADLLPNLGAGASLMLALYVALIGGWFGWIGCCLVASLLFHLADLRRRWRDDGPPS